MHVSPGLDAVATPLALAGAAMIGLDPMRVQAETWRLLEAQRPDGRLRHDEAVVVVPRRAGKSTAIYAVCVGRCASIDGYSVTYCAQSGTKSRERFYGLLRAMRRHDLGGPWRARESRGEERFEWENGSVLRFLPPRASSFRGDEVDTLVLDESQEHDPTETADLVGAALPMLDTRPDPQLIIAGTAGAARAGLLWESLQRGRAGEVGIIEYAAKDGADPDDPAVWAAAHPGPAGVTGARGMEVLTTRHERLGSEQFSREYLSLWPADRSTSHLTPAVWASCATEFARRPDRIALAFDVSPDRADASIVAAWRVGTTAYVEVVEHRPGASWVRDRVLTLSREYRCVVNYDGAGPALSIADELAQARPRPSLNGLSTADFSSACASLAGAAVDGRLQHFRQPALDEAVAAAGRRTLGDRWAWSRRGSSASISPLVGASIALRAWDAKPPRAKLRMVTAGQPRE